MKKILIYVLIILSSFNITNAMEESNDNLTEVSIDRNLGSLEILPVEIRYKIIKTAIENYIENLNDIINFRVSLLEELNKISLICKNFNVFKDEELTNFVKQLTIKRFIYLKSIIIEQYKNFSTQELNQKLIELLDCKSITKQDLEEAFRLIIAGAEINSEANGLFGRWTILIHAAKFGYTEIVRILIKEGANIKGQVNQAFQWAGTGGHTEIVKLLIKAGANIDIENGLTGSTILMSALSGGHKNVAKLLIKKGANVNICNQYGNTALKLAEKLGYSEIAALLKSKGAQ